MKLIIYQFAYVANIFSSSSMFLLWMHFCWFVGEPLKNPFVWHILWLNLLAECAESICMMLIANEIIYHWQSKCDDDLNFIYMRINFICKMAVLVNALEWICWMGMNISRIVHKKEKCNVQFKALKLKCVSWNFNEFYWVATPWSLIAV